VTRLQAWAVAFVLTCAIEVPGAVYCAWRLVPGLRRTELVRLACTSLLGQSLTHPLVWFVFPLLPLHEESSFALSEIFAWLVEAGLYWRLGRLPWRAAFAISGLANAASLGAGLALENVIT
jgi:hypothetical protein